MFGPLWGRYWIQQGIEVYHRNDIDNDGMPIEGAVPFIVDKVDKQIVGEGEHKGYRIIGVVCHWYHKGDFKKGLFFTKELVPKEVVDKGLILDWLKRS